MTHTKKNQLTPAKATNSKIKDFIFYSSMRRHWLSSTNALLFHIRYVSHLVLSFAFSFSFVSSNDAGFYVSFSTSNLQYFLFVFFLLHLHFFCCSVIVSSMSSSSSSLLCIFQFSDDFFPTSSTSFQSDIDFKS